jgi:hypothetical protein
MLKLFHLAQLNKEKKNCKTNLFWQLINQVDCLESAGIGTGPPLTRGQILYNNKNNLLVTEQILDNDFCNVLYFYKLDIRDGPG